MQCATSISASRHYWCNNRLSAGLEAATGENYHTQCQWWAGSNWTGLVQAPCVECLQCLAQIETERHSDTFLPPLQEGANKHLANMKVLEIRVASETK